MVPRGIDLGGVVERQSLPHASYVPVLECMKRRLLFIHVVPSSLDPQRASAASETPLLQTGASRPRSGLPCHVQVSAMSSLGARESAAVARRELLSTVALVALPPVVQLGLRAANKERREAPNKRRALREEDKVSAHPKADMSLFFVAPAFPAPGKEKSCRVPLPWPVQTGGIGGAPPARST